MEYNRQGSRIILTMFCRFFGLVDWSLKHGASDAHLVAPQHGYVSVTRHDNSQPWPFASIFFSAQWIVTDEERRAIKPTFHRLL